MLDAMQNRILYMYIHIKKNTFNNKLKKNNILGMIFISYVSPSVSIMAYNATRVVLLQVKAA